MVCGLGVEWGGGWGAVSHSRTQLQRIRDQVIRLKGSLS
jgi:hypothetical protein